MKNWLMVLCLFFYAVGAFAEEFKTEDVRFMSNKVLLSGSIVFPKNKEIRAAVVFVHGSGKQERNLLWAEKFAEKGIVALVYDKRGVGKSEGQYEGEQSVSEKNILLLADDAVAALEVLSKHPQLQNIPLGLSGISQAGWIVPIAAQKSSAARFMVLWSGPVCKVSEEDIFSKFTVDRDFAEMPTYAQALSARKEKYYWPDFLGKDTDPGDTLKKLKIPGLWIFGTDDGSVPVDLSISRLTQLRQPDHQYNYVLFSGVGHNNMPETFATATDWILRIAN
jgi:uncharacterized protein